MDCDINVVALVGWKHAEDSQIISTILEGVKWVHC